LHHLQTRPHIPRHELSGLLRQIDQDGAAFEYRHRLAAIGRRAIDDRRHPAVGAEFQEFRLVLIATAQLHRMDGIKQAAFLQHDGDLPAIRRRRVMQVDHRNPRRRYFPQS
jgi:hypothetical protein